MLALLLLLVLNHSVMAMGSDRDDVDVDFDLGYAILLGGLFVFLVYRLIPRPQREISYEEQEDFEEEVDDPGPQKNAEAEKDLDEDLLHAEYRQEKNAQADEDPAQDILENDNLEEENQEADDNFEEDLLHAESWEEENEEAVEELSAENDGLLRMMLAMVATRNITPMHILAGPGGDLWDIILADCAHWLKENIITEAATLDQLEGLCRQLAAEFTTTMVLYIDASLRDWVPTGVVSDEYAPEVLLHRLIVPELCRYQEGSMADMWTDEDVVSRTYEWAEAAMAEEGGLDGWQTKVEQYLADLVKEVIGEVIEACAGRGKFGPDGPSQAQLDMVNALGDDPFPMQH